MNKTEAIRHILIDEGIRQQVLADRLGITKHTLSARLGRDNITFDIFSEMIKALNYKIVLLPDTVKTPKGGYEVE